ncbi:trypsin-like peptidase domain-containing protein [Streptomyces sp. NBC_00859]|uniref:trypsin-like peptidase domain-containing protein n=1 Tax=Streptomyces sp. NBC_00859 TaxID=2903682 RepID=UPI00386904C2|nr:S1C family serine protease [Streptomyces sp. NBC_00859]
MGSGDLETLVRICDPAGRPRGTGFVADDRGTVVTGHEVIAGLVGAVLHGADGRTCRPGADAITALPELGLALVRCEDLGVPALPLSVRDTVGTGAYVRVAASGWRAARVLGETAVTYTAAGRSHRLTALELALGTQGSDALQPGSTAAGGPVVDASTGAVLAVLGTTLRGDHPVAGLAVPLRGTALTALLRRNAATVPGYGRDLNLAGVLELTATSVGASGSADPWCAPVERPGIAGALDAFPAGGGPVLGLVGAPGTGRTTELGALAARRARGAQPAPTLWLRGADLRADDVSVADAVARTVLQAGRIVGADGLDRATPERIAALAAAAGQPLLILLDGPEETAPLPAGALPEWAGATARWLGAHGARMVVACRPEYWEQATALRPQGADCVRIGDLPPREAERARQRYGIPEGMLAPQDAAHPLALRMLAEVRAAIPGGADGRPAREEVFTAYLDLLCLRTAVRIAAARCPAPRGTAVRRLAAEVSGRVHEAARRCLGPGQGELDRSSFEELFPWRTGWASAVLTEGLLTPAGAGYRFPHGELADWVQGEHLDVDGALYALVHRRRDDPAAGAGVSAPEQADAAAGGRRPTVPRHRAGTVVQALLLLGRRHGNHELGRRLRELIETLDRLQGEPAAPRVPRPARGPGTADEPAPLADAQWWAARLVADVLLRVPDARPYIGVLRILADRITVLSVRSGGPGALGGFRTFDSVFWERLRLGENHRLDLLRRLVPADGAPGARTADRYLDAAARRLAAEPRAVQPLLCRWFGDERLLPSDERAELRPTVAGAAQALLYTRRGLAVDDLAEALVDAGHPRADELLGALAEDETPALCRAVDRWAHDERPARRAAAARHAARAAAHTRTGSDRELLRYAALALLARPGDDELHGAALALLLGDPQSRARHLPRALALFASGQLPPAALAAVLDTHPETVFDAFEAALRTRPDTAGPVLDALAGISAPAQARRAAALVHEYIDRHPAGAVHAAAFVDRRLEDGPAAQGIIFPLVTSLLRGRPSSVREALAPVLAAPGSRDSRAMRAELLDVLLEYERYEARDGAAVLEALVRAAALGAAGRAVPRTRDLVHRTGMLLVRTPEGAARFDRLLVELSTQAPVFAGQLADWLADAPLEWAVVVGPSTRRTVGKLGAPMPMQAGSAGHGSLRPA